MSEPRSFERLAIVNRGEAAMRCIRAVKALRAQDGRPLSVIAIYTDPDRDAPFVRHADLAVQLPSPKGAVAAYLDHEALLRVLREVRADAVWPGWGFVAEDAAFVERLERCGITFLGPGPEAMRAVGDKIAAKHLAESADVPVTAWSGGELADETEAGRVAREIGFPVVVKASAGGGGRGIRMVESPEALAEAFRSAAAEAQAAFGDGRLFVEKRVEGGRHIEVQIAADQHGNVVAVGSRDCSVQRRHQKVLEEAPPPGVVPWLRAQLEEAAVRIAQRVGYCGVGTVEFLLSGEEFFFLEVNPRLQVEHGISEEITGIDLVQLQIAIARGESIAGLKPREQGHAIEARVCAEDPDQNFLPSPGRITLFDPAAGPRIRIDTGVSLGTDVPPDFDSLVAKVIATGDSREEARARLAVALRDFELVVSGGATNKGYLLELLDAEDYRRGGVDTTWLDRWSAAREANGDGAQVALVAAAIVAYQRLRASARVNFYSDPTRLSADRLPPSQGQQIDLSYEGESYRLDVYAIGSWRYRVHLDGRAVTATMREEGAQSARLIIDDRASRILYDATEMGLRVEVDGQPHRFGWQTAGQVRSATPAMVVSVDVEPGDVVQLGQPLGLLEAMKMEIGFQAPVSGTVSEVMARKGQQVAAGDVLLVIDPGVQDAKGDGARRLLLPEQVDPLAALFRAEGDEALGVPDVEAASKLDPVTRRRAIDTLREESRRVLLGYDANPARAESLAAFLEALSPNDPSDEFRRALLEIRRELGTFVDVERLFIRAPRASVSGELGPSNNARLRVYLRRMRAEGAGIADEFRDLLRRALRHYGVPDLRPGDALERAVLRMLSSQLAPELRMRLVQALIRRVRIAAETIDLSDDATLEAALDTIGRMRGLVPDAVADAAIDANYAVFQRPRMERRAEQSSKDVESWLQDAHRGPEPPPPDVLLELSVAPRAIFDRVGDWIAQGEPARRQIALAAHVQRRYAPRSIRSYGNTEIDGFALHWADYTDRGLVLAAVAAEKEIEQVTSHLCNAAAKRGKEVCALELVLPGADARKEAAIERRVEAVLRDRRDLDCRFTLELLYEDSPPVYKTFAPILGGMALHPELYDLHPETAERIDLGRLSAFELERLPSEEGIYAFYGRSRDVPRDERVFVLADVSDRPLHAGREVEPHLASFERAFHRATSALRAILQVRDPRRRLQWNRIALSVSAPVFLDRDTADALAGRLAPATRHLGLEKLLVRLSLFDRDEPQAPAQPVEIVFSDPSGQQMEISYRAPHHEPLRPAEDYERRVVEARRRRLVYPYEIVRMLTSEESDLLARGDNGTSTDNGGVQLPPGSFEEYDLDENAPQPRAISVADREPGRNSAAIVFGVVSNPTPKVPEGMRRVLVLSDPTLGMGALSRPECDRLVAAIDLAEQLGLPLEWVPVSSGAKIAMDSGTENLDATAGVVRRIVNFTQAGGEINLILLGVNVGAQSYFDALSTMLMHTRGVLIMTPGASMVLTGRAALEASGGVSAEDEVAIGGFERIMGPNGEAQYYARNLSEAYRTLFDYYDCSYVVPGESRPRNFETSDPADRRVTDASLPPGEAFDFSSLGEIFDDDTNPGRKRPFAMRALMTALVDQDGTQLERWRSMAGGETAVVWDAHLGGRPITLVGIESHNVARDGYRPLDGPEVWSGGTLFPRSSKKVARAINSASGNRPVVVLANLSGFDGSPESLRKLQLEYGAEIARAVVNFEGPILFLVVSRYHGGAYVVFSQALNDGLKAIALSGSYASVIGGGPAAAVVFAREVRARAIADERVEAKQRALRLRPTAEARAAFEAELAEVTLEKQAELAAEFDGIHTVERAREVGSLAGIVDPDEMRARLIDEIASGD